MRKPILLVRISTSLTNKEKSGIAKWFQEWEGNKDYYVIYTYQKCEYLEFELLNPQKGRKIDFDNLKKELLENGKGKDNSL